MARPFRLLVVSVIMACGGSDPVSPPPPPPPPPPGAPASVSIQAGDAQTASPGQPVTTNPVVLVRDAASRALPGVTVAFAIETGGGSVALSSTTTGAAGTASPGSWTLGPAEGTNRLRASVGALAPATFTAEGRFAAVTLLDANLPAGGGTITYRKAGDPLDGLSIVVPSGAFQSATHWTVETDSKAVPLPADFTQVGPTLVISNAQGYADSVITLSMPMQLGAESAVAPFYHDPVTGKLEAIPLVARTPTSATLATRHFSRDLMAIPGTTPAAGLASLARATAFGSVRVVWVKTPVQQLTGTFGSSFRPGVDDWEFENFGDYVAPGGDCEGMSIAAMYYHYFHKQAGAPGLYHQFDQSLPNKWDNVEGIRFVGSVQGDYEDHFAAGFDQTQKLINVGTGLGLTTADLTSTWILLTLKLNGQPVLLGLSRPGGGHAVIAYSATSVGAATQVSFADPNFPGLGRTMSFVNGQLLPVTLSLKSGAPEDVFDKSYALAVSAEVPQSKIAARYAEFIQKKAGADRYPSLYRLEVYDQLSDTWGLLGSTLQTTDAVLKIRHICPDCPISTSGAAPNEHHVDIWDAAGANQLANAATQNVAGTKSYLAVLTAFSYRDPTETGFVDAKPFTVTYQEFTVTADETAPNPGQTITYTAVAGPLAGVGSTYEWLPDDGGPAVTTSGPTYTHAFGSIGDHLVAVTLRDLLGRKVAREEVGVRVRTNVTLLPAPLRASPGDPFTMTAVIQGTIPQSMAGKLQYNWYIFDQAGNQVDAVDATVPSWTVTIATAGNYKVGIGTSVDGQPLSLSKEFPLEVKAWPGAWRLTSFTRILDLPLHNVGGIDPTAAYAVLTNLLNQAEATPSDALIFLDVNPPADEHSVFFQVAVPPGSGASNVGYVPGSMYTLLAWTRPPSYDNHYTSTGDLKSGTIDGAAYVGWGHAGVRLPLKNSIQATKTATGMSGTLTIGIQSNYGTRTYQFTAKRVP